MKKSLVIILSLSVLLCLMLMSCKSTSYSSQIKKGMTYDEVYSILPEKDVLSYLRYVFFTESDGTHVVLAFDASDLKVDEIKTYPKKEATADDFKYITNGMTIYEVVELVGIPFRTITSGLITLDFKTNTNDVYQIQFDNDMTVLEMHLLDK